MRSATILAAEPIISVVGEASNYAELVGKLNESKPDVVLTDVRMPGLRELDSFGPQLLGSCILAMSFWNNEETAKLAASFGAIKLLDKTKLGSELVSAIKECMRQSHASSPATTV